MNSADEPSFPVAQVFFHQPASHLYVLVHRLFVTIREIWPTLEEWRAHVELLPTADSSATEQPLTS